MARDYEVHVVVEPARKAAAEKILANILGSGPHFTIEIEDSQANLTHYAMSGPLPINRLTTLSMAFQLDKEAGGDGLKALSVDPRTGQERWNDEEGYVQRAASSDSPGKRFEKFLASKFPGKRIRREP